MPADPPRSPLPVLVLLPLALLVVALAAWVGGAVLLGSFPGLRPWMVAGLQLLFGLAVPLYLAAQVLAGLAARKPRPALVTSVCLLVWNLAWVALPAALAPRSTVDAVAKHRDWWLFQADAPGARVALDRLVSLLPGAPTPQAIVDATPAAPPSEPAAPPSEPAAPPSEPAPPAGPLGASELFAKRADSVVVIRVQAPAEESLFRLLLGLGENDKNDKKDAEPPLAEGLGSGFVVAQDGLIVTNWHVMQGARRAKVTLRSGVVLEPVTLMAKMPDRDLALISVPAVGLSPLPISGGAAAVGETAYAIGSPLGLEYTFTQGMISATREMGGASFVQTQTPIAPGSSGGPLLNERGELIGVNTAVLSQGSVGLAVQARYVTELMALPRTPQAIEPFVQGPTVVALDLSGVELTPVDRDNLMKAASLVAAQLDGCGLALKEEAWLKGPLANPKTTKAPVQSNLTGDDLDCAKEGTAIAWMVAMGVTEGKIADHPESALHLKVDHLSPVAGDTRPPEARAITLDLGPPPAPASPALPDPG